MSESKNTFTEQQLLADFRIYETVRQAGYYNMFDPRARGLTGLDRDEYTFVLKNYSELRQAWEAKHGELD